MTTKDEALKAALDALDEVRGNINPERSFCDELEQLVRSAHALCCTAPVQQSQDALDAKRYRWLREVSKRKLDFYSEEEQWMVSRLQKGYGRNFFGENIDTAIDAAIAAGENKT